MHRILLSFLVFFATAASCQPLWAEQKSQREAEAIRTATGWLDLLEAGKTTESFVQLTDIFRSNLTEETWGETIERNRRDLGELKVRTFKRVVVYQDPADAPLPGTYVAVEYDSIYQRAASHFQYVILHSLNGEPFKVMRRESVVVLDRPPEHASAR